MAAILDEDWAKEKWGLYKHHLAHSREELHDLNISRSTYQNWAWPMVLATTVQ